MIVTRLRSSTCQKMLSKKVAPVLYTVGLLRFSVVCLSCPAWLCYYRTLNLRQTYPWFLYVVLMLCCCRTTLYSRHVYHYCSLVCRAYYLLLRVPHVKFASGYSVYLLNTNESPCISRMTINSKLRPQKNKIFGIVPRNIERFYWYLLYRWCRSQMFMIVLTGRGCL